MTLVGRSCFLLFLIIFLLSPSHNSARFLTVKQGEAEEDEIGVKDGDSTLKMETGDSFDRLIGLEECENGDKECSTRRVLDEAHLDYIYTQHHKP